MARAASPPVNWQAVLAGKALRRVRKPAQVRESVPLPFEARDATWSRLQLFVSENQSGISGCSLLDLFRLAALELAEFAAADAAIRDPWHDEAPKTVKGAESAKRKVEKNLNEEAAEDRRSWRIRLFTERAWGGRRPEETLADDTKKRRIFGELQQRRWSDLFSVIGVGEQRRRPMTFEEFERELPDEDHTPKDRRSPRKHAMPPRSQFSFLHASLGPTAAPRRPANRPRERDALKIFSALASELVAHGIPDPYELLTRFKWTVYPPLFFAGGPPTIQESSPEVLSQQAEPLRRLVAKCREKQKDSRGKRALRQLRRRLRRLPVLIQ